MDNRKRNNLNGTLKQGNQLFAERMSELGTHGERLLLFESMAGLISAVAKYENNSTYSNEFIRKDVITCRIADVLVSLAELKKMYNLDDIDINNYVESRLAKLDCDLQSRLYSHLKKLDYEFSLL